MLRREEIIAEYELQIHFHEPRIRRSKEASSVRLHTDVANVRLTELSLHRARIQRHIDAVNLILQDLRSNIIGELNNQLDVSQSQMLERVEVTIQHKLTQSTKSTMLKSLRTQVEYIMRHHMDRVRELLRETVGKLEDKIQFTRTSNSNLLGSIRLFSDGGNFASEEAKAFISKLNDLASQITAVEEEVAGKMEAMEKDRQMVVDQRMKTFEHDLRHHMTDVTYAENIVRCVTNAIAQIKLNAADNESQRKCIERELSQLELVIMRMHQFTELRSQMIEVHQSAFYDSITRQDVLTMPTMCGNTESPGQLWGPEERHIQRQVSQEALRMLSQVCRSAADRCTYLNCLRLQTTEEDSTKPASSLVLPTANVLIPSSSAAPKKEPGKPPYLPRRQSSVNQMGAYVDQTNKSAVTTANEKQIANKMLLHTTTQISRPGRSITEDPCIGIAQSIMREHAHHFDRSHMEDEKAHAKQTTLHDSEHSGESAESNDSSNNITSTTAKTATKFNKTDLSSDIFGRPSLNADDGSPETQLEKSTLMGRVRRICRENLNGTSHLSELYYRQKGLRPSTRPQLIPNTLDQALASLANSLRQYYTDMEIYRNVAVTTFAKQLFKLEEIATHLPKLLFCQLIDELKMETFQGLRSCEQKYSQDFKNLLKHIRQLRPGLGSPVNRTQLSQLEQSEQQRQAQLMRLAAGLRCERRAVVSKSGRKFSQQIIGLADTLFLRFDRLICEDDIEWTEKEEAIYSLTDMVALRNIGLFPREQHQQKNQNQTVIQTDSTNESDSPSISKTRGKSTWYGPKLNDLTSIERKVPESEPKKPVVSKTVGPDRPLRRMKKPKREKFLFRSMERTDEDLLAGMKERLPEAGYCLVTAKTSTAHLAALQSRDHAVKEFRQFVDNLLGLIDKDFADLRQNNETLQNEWTESVKALKDLYK
ncbi:hypothetical protein AHF37_01325 [Paragonimus kellicotti]|nr:hypothetical protein AHF37_01325 [Paragonimus kellicotti]